MMNRMQILSQTVLLKNYSTSAGLLNTSKIGGFVIEAQAPKNITCDWISPPDKYSNLRVVKSFIPANESHLEAIYRKQREATQEWNQQFWKQHNKQFQQGKEEFIKSQLRNPDGTLQKLTANDLSVFYKQFLEDNYHLHMAYNREWYKRNVKLVWLALRVTIASWFKK